MKHSCGVCGILSSTEITTFQIVTILENLQHRGRESGGIAYITDKGILLKKGLGMIKDIFNNFATYLERETCNFHIIIF